MRGVVARRVVERRSVVEAFTVVSVQLVAKEVRGPSVRLDLPPELGKISPWVNVRRLKFF